MIPARRPSSAPRPSRRRWPNAAYIRVASVQGPGQDRQASGADVGQGSASRRCAARIGHPWRMRLTLEAHRPASSSGERRAAGFRLAARPDQAGASPGLGDAGGGVRTWPTRQAPKASRSSDCTTCSRRRVRTATASASVAARARARARRPARVTRDRWRARVTAARAAASRTSKAARCRITRRIPKRGFTNPFREDAQVVRLDDLGEGDGRRGDERDARRGGADPDGTRSGQAAGERRGGACVHGARREGQRRRPRRRSRRPAAASTANYFVITP